MSEIQPTAQATAQRILKRTETVDRGSMEDISLLLEALIHATLAISEAIAEIDERLGDRL